MRRYSFNIGARRSILMKRKLNKLLLVLFFLGVSLITESSLLAQGFFYSSYENLKLIYNPAISASNNSMQLNALHRIQNYKGGNRINSNAVSLSRPLFNKLKTKRFGGVGLSFSQETASDQSFYQSLQISPSFAYNLGISKNQYLSMGIQGSYFQQSIADIDNYVTGNQWISNFGYDPSISSGEELNSLIAGYFSIGSGILWYMEDSKMIKKYEIGLSLFNYNRPKTNFSGTDESVPIMYSLQSSLRIFEHGQHQIYLEAVGNADQFRQLYGGGMNWKYLFENQNPFDPFTEGEISTFTRYFNEGRLSLGTAVSQKNYSFAFAIDIFTNNTNQNLATEFGVTLSKKINLVKSREKETSQLGYQLGVERKLGKSDRVNEPQKPKVEEVEKAYNIQKVEGNFSFDLRVNFNYGFNETDLNEEAKEYLKDIYYMLKANPALKLLITGHTDNVGSRKANRKVSEERAEKVMLYLIELGISADRMKSDGLGASEPLVPNDTPINKAKNRRVEFLIFAEKG